jgi:hypothetical protein
MIAIKYSDSMHDFHDHRVLLLTIDENPRCHDFHDHRVLLLK